MPASNLDSKITIKITKRIPLRPREELLTCDLDELYHRNLSIYENRNVNEKRVNSKLHFTRDGLLLVKGSWWLQGSTVSLLPYKNVLRFSPCPGRVAKVLMIIISEDRTKTELVVIKTKGQNYANMLLNGLQQNVAQTQRNMLKTSTAEIETETRPASYHFNPGDQTPTPRKSLNGQSNSLQGRRPAPNPPVPDQDRYITPKRVERLPDSIKRPERLRSSKTRLSRPTAAAEKVQTPEEEYSKISYDPETKVETLDSVVYYGQKSDKSIKSSSVPPKPRKSKSRPPRELSNLGGSSRVSRELDENNTPWEVNICYIKHDPLVGCVEDESGPIYMYTAHQLVSRDDYDNYGSDESDGDSFVDDDESDDASSSDSDGSPDENKELERFMMLGRPNNHTHATNNGLSNGSNGISSEVYEY